MADILPFQPRTGGEAPAAPAPQAETHPQATSGAIIAAFPAIVARNKYLVREAHKIAGGTHGASISNLHRFVLVTTRDRGMPEDAARAEADSAVDYVRGLIASWSGVEPEHGGPRRA